VALHPGAGQLGYNFTCNQPLHFSPRWCNSTATSVASSHAHEIYLVQVHNSNLRPGHHQPPRVADDSSPKELAQAESNGNITAVVKDTTWGTGGQIS